MRPITAFLILILSIVNASAADFDKGLKAYLAGDYATALHEFQQFAEQGDVDAQYILAGMYKAGEGVPQDYVQAAKWYRLAAEQGDVDAQNNLGFMSRLGLGVPEDYVQAHMWFNLAAATGNKDAAENKDRIAREMTPAQIAEAQRLATAWAAKMR